VKCVAQAIMSSGNCRMLRLRPFDPPTNETSANTLLQQQKLQKRRRNEAIAGQNDGRNAVRQTLLGMVGRHGQSRAEGNYSILTIALPPASDGTLVLGLPFQWVPPNCKSRPLRRPSFCYWLRHLRLRQERRRIPIEQGGPYCGDGEGWWTPLSCVDKSRSQLNVATYFPSDCEMLPRSPKLIHLNFFRRLLSSQVESLALQDKCISPCGTCIKCESTVDKSCSKDEHAEVSDRTPKRTEQG